MRPLLIIIVFFLSASLSAEPLCSGYLNTRLGRLEVNWNNESKLWELFGSIDGRSIEKLGEIREQETSESGVVYIETVKSHVQDRLGVGTALYEFIIQRKERITGQEVTRLRGSGKVDGNLSAMLETFIGLLSTKPGFKSYSTVGDWFSRFFECCSDIYKNHAGELKEAAKASPTYKIGKRLGFDFCESGIEFWHRDGSIFDEHRIVLGARYRGIHYNFELCRD